MASTVIIGAWWSGLGSAHERVFLEQAHSLVSRLESLWSRFLPDSEVSDLVRHSGAWVDVSDETALLLGLADRGWDETDGAFDPSLGHPGWRSDSLDLESQPDRDRARARLRPGTSFDPGGIGKGLAADLTAEFLADNGACGALVSVGGDLRIVGKPPVAGEGEGWAVDVELAPSLDDVCRIGTGGLSPLRLGLADGGVATSSPSARWMPTPEGTWHHLLDPRTRRPLVDSPSTATVVADRAWRAEVWTKALAVRRHIGLRQAELAGLPAFLADGSMVEANSLIGPYLAAGAASGPVGGAAGAASDGPR